MNAVYSQITDEIIALLEAGTVPWRRPWKTIPPRNLISDAPYRGINILLLASRGFTDPYWLTYKQAQGLGGNVRKGEKGTRIIYYEFLKSKTADEDEDGFPMLRTYHVFNAEQCEGIETPPLIIPAADQSLPRCEAVVAAMPDRPIIRHTGSEAYYDGYADVVVLPPAATFYAPAEYYATLFHELGHATNHPRRLNRPLPGSFGTPTYAKEELIAELCAAMLCGHTGIAPATITNSAAYIASWLSHLRSDPRLLVSAASAAQKAADFILATAEQPAVAQAS